MLNKTIAKKTAVLAMVLTFVLTGCGINEKASVISVNKGKDNISAGYANFVAKYTQALYDGTYLNYYGNDMWSTDYTDKKTMEDYVKDSVIDEIEEMYVIKKHAKDYKITMSKADIKSVKKAADKFMSDNSNKTLKAMGAKEEYVEEYLTYKWYTSKVKSAMAKEANVTISEQEAAQKTFSYVKFEEAEESKANELSQSSDFETQAKSLGGVVSKESYGSDYAEKGTLDQAVYQAAEGLSQGQVSSVVKVENDGVYVLRLDSAYDEEATKQEVESRKSDKEKEYQDEIISKWKSEYTFKLDKKVWAKVKFDKLFNMVNS